MDLVNSIAGDLIENGYFVPSESNEFEEAADFHNNYMNNDKNLHLILLPTEECNFRCVYCYESFLRGTMGRNVVEAVKKLIDKKIDGLKNLYITWFGGEPTEALDVIYEISQYAIRMCEEYNVNYKSGITTNGYNLDEEVFLKLIECDIRSYQITVDGEEKYHDQKRKLKDGGKTYQTILSNLVAMSRSDEQFSVTLRVNYDMENCSSVENFIENLYHNLNGDQRFSPFFHPVGKWGGGNDDSLLVCTNNDAAQKQFEFYSKATEIGYDLATLRQTLLPAGSICYAAKPWSLVIGSDGSLYKCTVALEDERKKVGTLLSDGNLAINEEKFNLWVKNNETNDPGCQKCFFRPTCQGASCPLQRLDTGRSPCPEVKKEIKRTLTAVAGYI